jgi:hypothetical protein
MKPGCGIGAFIPLIPATEWDAIRALIEPLGGLDLPEIPREPAREPPDFSGSEWDQPDAR